LADRGTSEGNKLKEAGTAHWSDIYISGATNESGFTALPGGYRELTFGFFGYGGYWWSSNETGNNAWYRDLIYDRSTVGRWCDKTKNNGFSVRCLKDN